MSTPRGRPGGLVVTVFGRPVTQGSKTRTRWGMRDDNGDRLRPWRVAVTDAALRAMDAVGTADPMGSVALADGTPRGVHSVDPLSPGSGKKGSEPVRTLDHVRDAAEMVGWERLEGPVALSVVFTFDPPKSAPKSRRLWPITRSSGDVDKLVRAVFDALTDAGVWRDDSQVVRLTASKAHVGDPWALHIPGCCVTVAAVGP